MFNVYILWWDFRCMRFYFSSTRMFLHIYCFVGFSEMLSCNFKRSWIKIIKNEAKHQAFWLSHLKVFWPQFLFSMSQLAGEQNEFKRMSEVLTSQHLTQIPIHQLWAHQINTLTSTVEASLKNCDKVNKASFSCSLLVFAFALQRSNRKSSHSLVSSSHDTSVIGNCFRN